MKARDLTHRLNAAHKLLNENSTSIQRLQAISKLLKGIDPKLDQVLATTIKSARDISHITDGEIIPLVAENLPESTDQDKKRKKRILAFLRHWQQLHSEYHRIKKELSASPEHSYQRPEISESTMKRIFAGLKGPWGILTLIALSVAVLNFYPFAQDAATDVPTHNSSEVLLIQDAYIFPDQVKVSVGPECQGEPHYHAESGIEIISIFGDTLQDPDPDGCGFGLVSDVKSEFIEF